ncbi:unnamed protein product [Effrenium voratum]|uniref:Uncharacterized protein n=1 Tax=Effrenium voratum TaxID=2562239 RepID=A0AA36MUC0_9DINO|nr:unnamed protein product [Effrenium voratum]
MLGLGTDFFGKRRQVVRALCALPGALVAAGTNDGCVRLWDASSGQLAAERQVAQSYILSLARDPDTGHLAAGTSEGQVVILEHAGSELKVLEELQLCGEVYGLSFLSSGDLACACGDGSCCVFTRAIARAAPKALREDFASRAQALAAARAPAPALAAGAAPGYAGGFDFSFPVDFGAQKLTLSWNRHEEPKAVAERFLRENNLDPRHSGDVVAFVMQSMATQGAGAGGIGGAGKEFNFPVEVMDGRRLTISWNRGENPQEVALNFARQHGGISAAELPDIVSFIQQASGGPVQMQQAAPSPVIPPAMQQELLQQVMAMGFPEQSARQALESSAWDAQLAVAKLLG